MLAAGLTINAGNGVDQIFGTGDGIRIFDITDPTGVTVVTMKGLTLTGGDISGGGEVTAEDRGGGLHVALEDGTQATVKDCVITLNEAGLLLEGRSFLGNAGGGVWASLGAGQSASKLTLAGSEISANKAGYNGGGVTVTSLSAVAPAINHLSVYNSTISGNQALHSTDPFNPSRGGGV